MGIMRVSDTSGTPEVLIAPKSGEIHHGPQMLPDGDHVLFTLLGAAGTGGSIVVQSVASNERDVLITPGVDAKYVPTGHLIYAVGGTLFAVPFDAAQRKLTGQAVPVIEGVARSVSGAGAVAHFSFSQTGSLVYISGPASMSTSRTDCLDGSPGKCRTPGAHARRLRISPRVPRRRVCDLRDG